MLPPPYPFVSYGDMSEVGFQCLDLRRGEWEGATDWAGTLETLRSVIPARPGVPSGIHPRGGQTFLLPSPYLPHSCPCLTQNGM